MAIKFDNPERIRSPLDVSILPNIRQSMSTTNGHAQLKDSAITRSIIIPKRNSLRMTNKGIRRVNLHNTEGRNKKLVAIHTSSIVKLLRQKVREQNFSISTDSINS
eukprot:TRINITY_DN12483_c0_g6_i2.p1 TRINITY_DN12483_c0_g6~~TRINITY_DN12483_c0_g6_i2.p1  ORF type:complete len:106 (-),score=4.64 TRINITY_DN12483_c0_g6_i2:285-602(-)